MGYTPGADSGPDDEGELGRKRPRSPEVELELAHVPKKQRRDLAIAINAATKPARPSKKRAHSPESNDPLRGDGGDDVKKRRRVRRETEDVSRGRKSAGQLPSAPPTPTPPPPPALVDRQYSREVAQVQRIRTGLQDIERRLAALARLCEEDGG